jgi:hypothetical protein
MDLAKRKLAVNRKVSLHNRVKILEFLDYLGLHSWKVLRQKVESHFSSGLSCRSYEKKGSPTLRRQFSGVCGVVGGVMLQALRTLQPPYG